jgi:hypothetical protein
MGMYVWVVVGIMLAAVYVLPVAVGLFVSRLRTAVMLAVTSFAGSLPRFGRHWGRCWRLWRASRLKLNSSRF